MSVKTMRWFALYCLALVIITIGWPSPLARGQSFQEGVQPYKDNFFLYTRDWVDHSDHPLQPDRQAVETRFQFSIRVPMLSTAYFPLFFGYTQKSFWQVFDKENSSPFRENNYNPEIFLELFSQSDYSVQIGLWEHESNGQVPGYSRSWNRFYIWPRMEFSNASWVALKVWQRYPEEPKTAPEDPKGDDNPFILDTLGYFEFTFLVPVEHLRFGGMIRKGKADKEGTFQLDMKFPAQRLLGWAESVIRFSTKTFLFATLFYGFGESLIDYDQQVKKAGIGMAVEF